MELRITPEERAKHDLQFNSLKPVNGFINGDQAKGFLMQSGLPGQVLAQIWGLADMNADGMMDKKEFSIAMYLIQRKLRGMELPKVLPDSLKADPQSGFTSPVGGMKQRAQTFGTSPAVDGSQTMMTSPQQSISDWSIPPAARARYQQTFVARDAARRGFLTGGEARGVLMESGLPQTTLAQIWNLSDIDNDGRLTQDEFMVAMYLVESARAGQSLPSTLPPNLVPPSCRKVSPVGAQPASAALQGLNMGSPMAPMGAGGGGMMGMGGGGLMGASVASPPHANKPADPLNDLMTGYRTTMTSPPVGGAGPEMEPSALDDLSGKTFEDRRKENFDKGQAELEKRRALLREQQKAEEEARLALERAEQEKREQHRLEQERKKQQELEKQLQRQREMEQEKEEQRRKAMEQREAARRELERQRQIEWEKQRMEQLTVEKNRIQEEVLQLKSQNSNTNIELETLENKKNELAGKIEQSTVSVKDITGSIERMRQSRDIKLADIERLNIKVQEYESKQKKLDDEAAELTLQLETSMESNPVSDSYKAVMQGHGNKQLSIQKLTMELEQISTDVKHKQADLDNNNTELQSLNNQIATVKGNIQKLLATRQANLQKQQQQKKLPAQTSLSQKGDSWLDTFEDKSGFNQSPAPAGSNNADMFSGGSVSSSTGQGVEDSWATFADEGGKGGGADKKISQGIWEDAFSSKETAASTEVKSGVSRYRVLYPFEARHQDELTINTGDIVMVNDDQSGVDQDWMGGELNGKYGWFPEAYVEKITEGGDGGSAGRDLFGQDQFTISGATAAESSTEAVTSSVEVDKSDEVAPSPIPGAGQMATEGLQAQAIVAWRAKKENQLTFNKGDVINVEEQQEMWWRGNINGKSGWFPKSYVKLVGLQRESRSETPQSRKESLTPSMTSEAEKTEIPVPASAGTPHVAMYAYQSPEPGDLCFNQGDVIHVTKSDGDWWTGTLGEKSGIFPGNYVQKMESQGLKLGKKPDIASVIAAYHATGSEQLSLAPGQLIMIRKRSPSGWWEGELQARGQKKKIGWFPANYVKVLGPGSNRSTPVQSDSQRSTPLPSMAEPTQAPPPVTASVHTPAPQGEQVMALYPYEAQNTDELTFERDVIINVLNKDDPDWWKGELNGKTGLVPANYVKALSESG